MQEDLRLAAAENKTVPSVTTIAAEHHHTVASLAAAKDAIGETERTTLHSNRRSSRTSRPPRTRRDFAACSDDRRRAALQGGRSQRGRLPAALQQTVLQQDPRAGVDAQQGLKDPVRINLSADILKHDGAAVVEQFDSNSRPGCIGLHRHVTKDYSLSGRQVSDDQPPKAGRTPRRGNQL
jgi:hypothetical protein